MIDRNITWFLNTPLSAPLLFVSQQNEAQPVLWSGVEWSFIEANRYEERGSKHDG